MEKPISPYRYDYVEQPFGPLTREAYDTLGIATYDASQTDRQKEAAARGMEPGESSRLKFAEKLAHIQVERTVQIPTDL